MQAPKKGSKASDSYTSHDKEYGWYKIKNPNPW